MGDRAAAIEHRYRHDRHARDVVAAIDAEALAARQVDFPAPGRVGGRPVPAQSAEPLLDLAPGMPAEGGEATAGGADQGGEAAADIDMQAHRGRGAGKRHHHHVVEIGQLDADCRHAVAARQRVEPGAHQAGEVAVLQEGPRQRQHADAQPVALGLRVDPHQLLGAERAQDVQRRARHQAKLAGDVLQAKRRAAAAQQAKHGDRPRHRRNGPDSRRSFGRHDCIYTIYGAVVQRTGLGHDRRMAKLTDFTRYADAQAHFSSAGLWELFDGDRARLNIAQECIDRHAERSDPALIVVHADGRDEVLSFREVARDSARFAHWLAAEGVQPGDRVAIMLEPSRAFYAALFGTMKRGAIAVPLFTLFGPDGVRLRVEDSTPRLLVTNAEKAAALGAVGPRVVVADRALFAALE